MRLVKSAGFFLRLLLFLIVFLETCSGSARAKIRIVATSTAFGEIAKEIGGDRVVVKAIALPTQDIHFIEPKPSDILRLSRADLFIHAGLDLELWRGPLIEAASNLKIFPGSPGYFDASQGIALLEVPTHRLTRAEGDIHIFGNPHYWLDPLNGKIIARHLRDRLATLSPGDRGYFDRNLGKFNTSLDDMMRQWRARLQPFTGAKVVFYHNSWVYFAERFKLRTVGFLEPKPNIPPSGTHLRRLITKMKQEKVRVIVIEPFHPRRPAEAVAGETGAEVLVLGTQPGWNRGTETYTGLFDYLVHHLASFFGKTRHAREGEKAP